MEEEMDFKDCSEWLIFREDLFESNEEIGKNAPHYRC